MIILNLTIESISDLTSRQKFLLLLVVPCLFKPALSVGCHLQLGLDG